MDWIIQELPNGTKLSVAHCPIFDNPLTTEEAHTMIKAKKRPPKNFKVGDKVRVKISYGVLGKGTIGTVVHARIGTYPFDDIGVDVKQVWSMGKPRKTPWSGHDCNGLIQKRNGKYYGSWIERQHLELYNDVSDDDILLLD